MPKILSGEHTEDITSAIDYSTQGYDLKESAVYQIESAGMPLLFHTYTKEALGCVTMIDEENTCIGKIKFTFPQSQALVEDCVQIESVFVKSDYRGLGIAPTGYLHLTKSFNVISDTAQTEFGVNLWRKALASQPEICINIIKGYGTNDPDFLRDDEGNKISYKYRPAGDNPIDSQVWGYDEPDPRMRPVNISPEISASMEQTREDVVLVASKSK